MDYVLGKRSLSRLEGVHLDLVTVVKKAITCTTVDFSVMEGVRTEARQLKLFEKGATSTMASRHLTGHAVDLAPYVDGEIRWDWPLFNQLGAAMKLAAIETAIPIEWGGDWQAFRDGPHFQLPRQEYPG